MVGVDLFFVISGFIMVYISWNKPRGIKAVSEFLFSRVFRIYPLYWAVSAALILLWLWRPEIVFSSIEEKPDIIKSLALWPDSRPPILAVGWTLIHEVFFYLVFAVSLLFSRRALVPFLFIWAVLIAAGIIMNLTLISPLLAILFSPLSFEFLGGALAAWVIITKSPSKRTGWVTFIFGCLSLIAASVMSYANFASIPVEFMARILYFAFPCTLIIFGVVVLEKHGTGKTSLLPRLGDWSYGLYLTHILSLSLLGRLWGTVDKAGIVDNAIILPALTLLSILVAFLTWRLVEHPINKIVKTTRKKLFSNQDV